MARESEIEICRGLVSFLNGEDDTPDGIVDVDGLADFEPVTVTLNAGFIRAAREVVSAWRGPIMPVEFPIPPPLREEPER